MLLNEKTKIYGREVNNRVVLHPMEGCDGNADGSIGELTRRRYLRFAESGAGIIWLEATAVSSECRANPRQLYINENNKDSFKNLVAEIKQHALETVGFEPIIIMQATNSGRWSKPNGTPEPLIAYHNPLWEKGKENLPYTVVTDEYCNGVVEKYAAAARLASYAGFDGIDVKCCHGYLMNELLSAFEREGKYGGSFENRTRLYFDCLNAVFENKSDSLFVTTRLNACDCFDYPYGFGVDENNNIDLTETKKIIASLEKMGVELINLTLGNPYLIPHINRPYANAPEAGEVGEKRIYDITKELQQAFPNVKLIMSGLSFLGAEVIDYAEKALEDSAAFFAGFGRMSFCYPSFYSDFLKNGELNKSKCCLACGKCTELMRHGCVAGCPIRDSEVYMPLYKKYVLNRE
ncbi:MAG: flavin oxidoreductase/NADH oxidase [Clostridia bacterium]|nr:flavin oxidoreductase/NADH oxidase [Clostridia bacterium]